MKRPQPVTDRSQRTSSVYALLGIRAPIAEHTRAESELLKRYTLNAKTIVEIGVAEGASAWEARQGMAADGDLYLIDPFPLSRFGRLAPGRLVAHRLVNTGTRGRVTWIEELSQAVAKSWSTPIDVLFIDGDHSYDGVKADWEGWSGHVKPGGHAILHDARVEAEWTEDDGGPVRLLREIQVQESAGWQIVGEADSMAVLRRSRC